MTACHFKTQPIPQKAGIGLRHQHYQRVLETTPKIPWVEVHSENFFAEGGAVHRMLERIREHYPLSLHGVGLSLGSVDLPDSEHLRKLKKLSDRYAPGLISEHISWSRIDGVYMNDLLPLPYTEESLDVICRNIDYVQEYLGRQILVENPSTYLEFAGNTMTESEFIAAILEKTGCGLLLDINNVYVVTQNHGGDPYHYLTALPEDKVQEIHLAGHDIKTIGEQTIRIDTHGVRISEEVWALYFAAVERFKAVPTLIEWDTDVPALEMLLSEMARAQAVLDSITERGNEIPTRKIAAAV